MGRLSSQSGEDSLCLNSSHVEGQKRATELQISFKINMHVRLRRQNSETSLKHSLTECGVVYKFCGIYGVTSKKEMFTSFHWKQTACQTCFYIFRKFQPVPYLCSLNSAPDWASLRTFVSTRLFQSKRHRRLLFPCGPQAKVCISSTVWIADDFLFRSGIVTLALSMCARREKGSEAKQMVFIPKCASWGMVVLFYCPIRLWERLLHTQTAVRLTLSLPWVMAAVLR